MFYLRGALVCISILGLVYVCVSAAVGRFWRAVAKPAGVLSSRSFANTLFAMRMAPVLASVIVVGAFAAPSFLRLEPRGGEEPLGAIAILLSSGFALLASFGAARVWRAVRYTRQCVRQWTGRNSVDEATGAFLVDSPNAPPVVLAGVTKTTLVISTAAHSALSAGELDRVLAHEISHRQAWDNLKKLLLRAFAFPGMTELDRAWLEAIELSADSEAVGSQSEALDLASALVKIARLHGPQELPELVSGLVPVPKSGLEARIEKLLHWRAERPHVISTRQLQAGAFCALVAVACNYPTLLRGVHVFTEILMR